MIGQVLGHFTVIAKLGEGGQGTVYLATDNKLERKVALKILLPQALEDESLYRRFILEAKAAASLDHPNICTVYSIEEVNEQTLLAMAYLEGETIRQKLEHGPLPLDEAVDFALQTLRGLDAAHKEGIVHRDIKSSNLMVVDQGSVKVLDFGLAVAANRTRITATNTVLGTPAYMSPEQVRGETVDHRSDLWSVGVVLHEMVTGRKPFRGENAHAMLMSILNQEPEPLTGLRTGVPVELDRIVRKALAKAPGERYQHADDFSADLRLVQKDISETSAMRSTLGSIQPKEIRPRWLGWIPWGIAALATLFLIIVTSALIFRVETQPPDTSVMRLSINLPDESGREEVYVQAFPEMTQQTRISNRGGVEPLWSPDGTDLYFRSPDGREAFRTSFEVGPEPKISPPEHLFSGNFQEHNPFGRTWDLSPDGQRFLLFEQTNPVSRHELQVIVNWTREVEEKLARQR